MTDGPRDRRPPRTHEAIDLADAEPVAHGDHADDPPVVARMVIEIRSDGRRTIARGAVHDAVTGQATALEARGDSPAALALALARTLFKLPRLSATRSTLRALLPGRGKPK